MGVRKREGVGVSERGGEGQETEIPAVLIEFRRGDLTVLLVTLLLL